MSDEALFLLIDQGGQSSRVLVIDAEGNERFRTRRAVITREPEPGRAEQDGDAILADLRDAIRQAFVAPKIKAVDIVAAGLAVQRGNVLCWDRETGRALTPVLSWRDRRQPRHQPPEGVGELVRRETGLRHSDYGGAAKLRWCLESVPAVARALERDRLAFGPLGAFLVHGLVEGNPHLVDETLAQRTLLYSRHTGSWSAALLEAFGLPSGPLPAPVPSEHEFGRLADADHALPLKLSIGDQNIIPSIETGQDPDCVFINLGTGAFVLRPLPIGPTHSQPAPFQLSIIARRGRNVQYALEASVHGAGSALNRLCAEEATDQVDSALDEALAPGIEPGLFLNTVDGLGSPWWCPGIRPEFVPAAGLDRQQRLAAVVESIVFLLRVNLEQLAAKRGPAGRVLVAGGLSRSERLCQHLADGLGCRIECLRGGEATSVGLWRRLSASREPGPGYRIIDPEASPALEDRYREWRRRMPPVPRTDHG